MKLIAALGNLLQNGYCLEDINNIKNEKDILSIQEFSVSKAEKEIKKPKIISNSNLFDIKSEYNVYEKANMPLIPQNQIQNLITVKNDENIYQTFHISDVNELNDSACQSRISPRLIQTNSNKRVRESEVDEERPMVIPKGSNIMWTIEEDRLLLKLYNDMGSRWASMCDHLPRWTRTQIKIRCKSLIRASKRLWKQSEEELLLQLCRSEKKINWDKISKLFPGRTKNSVKSHFQQIVGIYQGPSLHASDIPPAPGSPRQALVGCYGFASIHKKQPEIKQTEVKQTEFKQPEIKQHAKLPESVPQLKIPSYPSDFANSSQRYPQTPSVFNNVPSSLLSPSQSLPINMNHRPYVYPSQYLSQRESYIANGHVYQTSNVPQYPHMNTNQNGINPYWKYQAQF